jgi:hypothetical protein
VDVPHGLQAEKLMVDAASAAISFVALAPDNTAACARKGTVNAPFDLLLIPNRFGERVGNAGTDEACSPRRIENAYLSTS